MPQWRYDQISSWMNGRDYYFSRKTSALKYCFKMLSRRSNNCPWRIIECDTALGTYKVVFESSIDEFAIRDYYVRNFTKEEKDEYYLAPIINKEN